MPRPDKHRERMAANPQHDHRLIWIDLEMTGLDTDNDSILEIATVVTDAQLQVLAEGPEFAIGHPLARLEAMDEWNRNQKLVIADPPGDRESAKERLPIILLAERKEAGVRG